MWQMPHMDVQRTIQQKQREKITGIACLPQNGSQAAGAPA
jgi:hypothetical protein